MSAPASVPSVSSGGATVAATTATATASTITPSQQVLVAAAKLAMEQDRAIMLDYFTETAKGTAFLGEDHKTNERVLIKSKEEFTSLIKKLYKVGDDFIILTENSLYIVSGKIQKKKVDLAALMEAYDASI